MKLAGKSLTRRALNSLFIGVVLFAVTGLTGDGIEWTLILVGPPVFFAFELVADTVLQRLRQWWAT